MDNPVEANPFKCPNCDGDEVGIIQCVSPDFEAENHDPWLKVMRSQGCANCGRLIPAHLGERWNNKTAAEAKREWFEVYEKTSTKPK